MSIEVKNINKRFGSYTALQDVNLAVEAGELVALLGPSGSGKTTLLRIIAGLETSEGGSIRINGEDTTHRHVRERQVGFVFQHYALFKHMTVFENVAFGLRVKSRKARLSDQEIREKVSGLLKLVQLESLADRHPSQLSGGQRQRIALARALAVEPQILLLDEPFGALDAQVRQELRRWLRRLHDEIHITSVFVTHDQEEALELADRIVVMREGRIEQVGTPEEVYEHPANAFVLNFLGNVNLFHSRNPQFQGASSGGTSVIVNDGEKGAPAVVGYVRTHDLAVERQAFDHTSIEAKVLHIHAIGPIVRVSLALSGGHETLEAELTRDVFQSLALKKNEQIFVRPRQVRVFEDYQI
ncbi:MAG: sulfate ABC transporter ATP-binding protein [Deltaproteobacteria bacterium]